MLEKSSTRKKALGFFQLVMINVIAVDSIRTLPFSAVYGFTLVFFYLLAALAFFIPTALVSAELGTGWPTHGGIYVWVREAFGKKISFITIWLNWIYNVFWFPTIMALIAGTFAYFFEAQLADNRLYMCLSVLILFWGATLINWFGMRISSFFSTIGALIGTIFPMLLITVLGIIWVVQGNPLQTPLDRAHFFPTNWDTSNLAFLSAVLFGLLGLEMSATHAAEMRNPKRDYPRSLLVSVVIIFATIVLASLALAIVIPANQLSLATGIMQAFTVFTEAYGIPWLLPLIAGFIVLGGLSAVSAWIIGPTQGLLVACHDGSLPKFFGRTNKHGAPTTILVTQALIVSLLSLLFILLPTVNSSYWLLSIITAQLALLVYMALFAAALKLYYSKPHVERSYRVPGKKVGIWSVCLLGIISCIVVILLGFLPPSQVPFKNIFIYETILFGGMALCCVLPLIIIKKR